MLSKYLTAILASDIPIEWIKLHSDLKLTYTIKNKERDKRNGRYDMKRREIGKEIEWKWDKKESGMWMNQTQIKYALYTMMHYIRKRVDSELIMYMLEEGKKYK